MEFSNAWSGKEHRIIDMFADTFSASEGADEGAVIGDLVRKLLADTPRRDIHVFLAEENGALAGAAIFSRLTYADDTREVFILSPMAIATNRQGQGVGQALLTHALKELREAGVDVAITYGDPAFYGKVGFQPMTQATAASPLPLSQPHGWIGQSLAETTLAPLKGACTCVAALNDPAIW